MKLLHRILALLLVVLLGFCGLLLLLAARSSTDWQAVLMLLRQQRVAAAGAGAAALCVATLYAISGLRRRERARFLSFGGDGDRVNISTDAIVGYVARLAEEFPSIVRMTPRVRPAGKKVDMLIDVRIKAGPQLHEICEVLQQRVRESMASGLGISEVRRVIVSVTEISSEHKNAIG